LFNTLEIAMAAWYELGKSSDGQFRFVLKAGNGETILTSELYKAKPSAEAGIASVQANGGHDERYEKKVAANGKYHFNLKAANHQVIGSAGIQSVKTNCGSTTVKDNA
jgi:uncharacterized protein YegP (UPF0339 family)